MSTPAQDKGLVVGQKYHFTDEDGKVHVVTFRSDDASRSPSFYVPDEVDSNGDGWNFISLSDISKIEPSERVKEKASFTVAVENGRTVIELGKELTAAQVAAVLAAAEVE